MTKLIILCGPPYAGKTSLAKVLVGRFGYQDVDVDTTKETLYGPVLKDDDLTQNQWNDIYARTDSQIEGHLRHGRTVIDGSRNFRRAERTHAKEIAERWQAQLVVVRIEAPVEVVRARMVENRINPTRHDMSDQEFEALWQFWEAPSEDENPLILEHGADVQSWMDANSLVLG